MKLKDLYELLEYIYARYNPISCPAGFRSIKYVDSIMDMRGGVCFSVTLRGYGWARAFVLDIDNDEPLRDRVTKFLTSDDNRVSHV